ncbi:MAG: hypothetical protein JST68_23335 [Bacteroidetes bacterium]|nr:hypothetical protein [Bacteroidota bacterium]
MAASYSIRENFQIELYGISGIAENRNWAKTGISLMDKMWKEVKTRQLPNKGINVWVYEPGDKMFAGVELTAEPPGDTVLERKVVMLPKYIWALHVGPYDRIPDSFKLLSEEFDRLGIKRGLPYLEIYGHWNEDVSKLETELLWSLF